jgi:sterol desaturase/sphingolipid hydroxylase (fatty acid hydroxylase superfamily)
MSWDTLDALDKIRILSTTGIVLVAVLFIVLERFFPYNKGQKLFRDGFFNDFVLYTLVQSYVLGLVISYLITAIDNSTHLSRLQLVSAWPAWVQLLFFLVLHDFYIYCFHRYQHSSKYFWRTHEAHHTNTNVDWLSGSRSHSLEILINQTIEFAPIVLLGAAPEVAIYKGMIDSIWGMYIHANIDVEEGWLQYIINGPEMHHWHHAADAEAHNKNFATKLAVWDWLFGTAYYPKGRKPKQYGLPEVDFPKNYFKQHAFAFRKFE